MPEPEWIEYNNKKILFASYSCDDKEEIKSTLKKAIDMVLNSGENNALLLSDLTNMPEYQDLTEPFKETNRTLAPRVYKHAVLGLTPLKTMYLNIVKHISGMNIVAFKVREEALEWLVE